MIPGLIQGVVDSAEQAQFESAHIIRYADVSCKVESVIALPDTDFDAAPDQCYRINLTPMPRFQVKLLGLPSPSGSCISRHPTDKKPLVKAIKKPHNVGL